MKPQSELATDTSRSPLSLTILEAFLALIGGGFTWFWLRYRIWNAQPYGWEFFATPNEPYPDWFLDTRAHLLMLTWPVAVIMAISVICLVRSIQENIHGFSNFGHLILAWPLIEFLPWLMGDMHDMFGCMCLPLHLGLALVMILAVPEEEKQPNDFIVLPISIMWTLLSYWYNLMWWNLIGD